MMLAKSKNDFQVRTFENNLQKKQWDRFKILEEEVAKLREILSSE
jgi:hypothetical protein